MDSEDRRDSRPARRGAGTPPRAAPSPPFPCVDERAAAEFLEAVRWADTGPRCPRCGHADVYRACERGTVDRSARLLWCCRGCGRRYTVRLGTFLQSGRIPLRHWCYVFWAACASDLGVTAEQLRGATGVSHRAAVSMVRRGRAHVAATGARGERGPDPDALRIDGEWEDAVRRALQSRRSG